MPSSPITLESIKGLVPARPAEAHKGTFGHLFVLAGSRGFTGAAKMVCLAAARSGTGLVTAGVPRPLGDVIAASLTEIMSFMLPSTREETLACSAVEPALEFASDKAAVALGPGISQHPRTRDFVLEFVKRCSRPMIIDADGINALSAEPECLKKAGAPCLLTPHPGEMSRLIQKSTKDIQANREAVARDAAAHYGITIVLKGAGTVVASPDGDLHVNTTGNSGMASGGTGDVLSGILGALMAQGSSCLDAARLGVYVHGLAGDLAAKNLTERALIATDLIDYLPAAWRAIEDAG